MESYAERFHKNPSVDPKTGSKLQIGSKQFKQLTNKYGEVKIVSPETKNTITVGKGSWKDLIKKGYTEDQLLSHIKVKSVKPVKRKTFKVEGDIKDTVNKDILYNIMLNADYETTKTMCLTNKTTYKICEEKQFWKDKITKDFPYFPTEDVIKPHELYHKLYNFYDKHTLLIISTFIKFRKKRTNIQDVYDDIFTTLVNYVSEALTADDVEIDDLRLITLKRFFDILTIPIKKSEMILKRPLNINTKSTNWNKLDNMLFTILDDDKKGF